MQKITPCLWFESGAEEAIEFYCSVFKNSEVLSKNYYGQGGPLPAGSLLTAVLRLDEFTLTILNGGPYTKFTPAISFMITCENQEEIDYHWDKLLDGGEAEQCGWLKDKFGISWQVVPNNLEKLFDPSDPGRSQRVMNELLKMVKLDMVLLEKAYRGE
jgi:predicted 3-demethylubiquinone-9 3-methyltransferase (glyoxalase superfamily)